MVENIIFTDSTTAVYLATNKVDHTILNTIANVTPPSTDGTPNPTMLINLNRIENRYTIMGYINEGKLADAETCSVAKDKKDALVSMSKKGNTVIMTYEGDNFLVGVEKILVTYVPIDEESLNDGDVKYNVTITVIEGVDII